ncbi:MAG: molybdopterin molybdotransferase MoeA [Nitrospirae bacterium]|nr:molybdopterin molybdotransferase MoeA [Nitrospirota bacterium]
MIPASDNCACHRPSPTGDAQTLPPPGREPVAFQDALALVLEAAGASPDIIERPLFESLGGVLAEDIIAQEPLPSFDQSAMDGYAVRAGETVGASAKRPVRFSVIGEVAAGAAPACGLIPGTAMRIMTGARLPIGADAVVPVEQVVEWGEPALGIDVPAPVRSEAHLRRRGEDVRPGTPLLPSGTRLTAVHIGLLASQSLAAVRLFRTPTVALLSTGNELMGGVRNVNGPMLTALLSGLGCSVINLGIAGDDTEAIVDKLAAGAGADVVVTSGGVSVGRHDHVAEAMERFGVEWLFRKVRIKPGMPMVAGRRGRQLCFGLPGNPVSALVTCVQFVKPALLKMMGVRNALDRVMIRAVLEHAIAKEDRKRHFHRMVVELRGGGYCARSSGGQGSHMVASLARANGLLVIPEESRGFDAGQLVDVELL